jgi:hypothetical protein
LYGFFLNRTAHEMSNFPRNAWRCDETNARGRHILKTRMRDKF